MGRWRGVWWATFTVVTMFVLMFVLGVPASLRWIVQKFWRVIAGFATLVVLMLVPPMAGSPGVEEARAVLLWGGGLAFAGLFVCVFMFISRSAWRNAWQAYVQQRETRNDPFGI